MKTHFLILNPEMCCYTILGPNAGIEDEWELIYPTPKPSKIDVYRMRDI